MNFYSCFTDSSTTTWCKFWISPAPVRGRGHACTLPAGSWAWSMCCWGLPFSQLAGVQAQKTEVDWNGCFILWKPALVHSTISVSKEASCIFEEWWRSALGLAELFLGVILDGSVLPLVMMKEIEDSFSSTGEACAQLRRRYANLLRNSNLFYENIKDYRTGELWCTPAQTQREGWPRTGPKPL